ncbi:TIGR02453 family protein [Arenibacter palladensis]|uniref:TIGR02453 family protein n=1 Tax=Arenibacter palladensis TaxID=237373 RepID=A0A1M4YS62_9FLAO|nr:TIGR02453 family protein [Arenibacter palladensis]
MSRIQQQLITKDVFQFLENLKKNNSREWFAEHKTEFKELETEVKSFYSALMNKLKAHDDIEKLKMFRIYRDVRFSKDKTPYKTHFAGSFSRAGQRLRGGYYLRLKPKETFIAAGFWEPNKEDLFRIRKEFETDASEIRAIMDKKSFKEVWGDMQGDELKTAPSGFDKDHPNIDLIKRKQFIFIKNFSDKEVMSPNFLTNVDLAFQEIRPYFNLMSDILTTNLNGESLLD